MQHNILQFGISTRDMGDRQSDVVIYNVDKILMAHPQILYVRYAIQISHSKTPQHGYLNGIRRNNRW